MPVPNMLCTRLFALSKQKDYFYAMERPKKLTPYNLAFGIGRKATREELEELFSRPTGKSKEARQFLKELKERNALKTL